MSTVRTNSILRWAGAATLLLLIVLLIVEGTWAVRLYHSWFFVALVLLTTVLLLTAGVRDVLGRRWTAAMSHLGLALVLLGGMLGAVVEDDCKIVVDRHVSERVAYDKQRQPVVLPFSLQLEDFHIDYYDDGTSPKQYTSSLMLDRSHSLTTSVNHPARYDGWWIYQSDYDRANEDFVILQLVRDPWLPVVYVGFALMVLGALMQLHRAWHSWKVLPMVLVVTAVFTVLSLLRIELGTLVPALRSLWFFPHILIYMLAYSMLAIALVLSLIDVFGSSERSARWGELASRLLQTTSALLLVAMLCGAVWAKDAWGQYWTWDAKECWAAVTWLMTILSTHIPRVGKKKGQRACVFILLSFLCMQVTWYGVNWLPAAAYSMHTYTK